MNLYSNEIIELLQQLDANHVLLENSKEKFTVSMLLQESQILAANLREEGMKEKDRIVIASAMGTEFVKIMFATMMLKCEVAIIDPEMGRENYKYKLEQFNPQWVFLDSRIALLQEHPILRLIYFYWKKVGLYFPRNKNIKKILTGPRLPIFQTYIPIKKLLQSSGKENITLHKTEALPYLVTYTSGTLSEPKGVLHTTESLHESIQLIAALIRSEQKQIMATHLPHFMLIAACAGVATKLWGNTWSPKKRLTFIEEEKISILFAPPSEYLELINYCEKNNRMLPNSLTHVLLGSAPVHQVFLKRLIKFLPAETRITCLYGMTENLVVTSIDGRKKATMSCAGDPLGYAAKGLQIKIAADDEILLNSNQLFYRYWHLEKRSEWHPTGDLGYVDATGNLILKGRKKDMIIRRNFNLYPALYIPTIKEIEGITDAVLVGKYDETKADEEVHLFIESEISLSKKYIRKQLESGPYSIDKEAWPDFIHFKKIPRKGRQQKIDRMVLMDYLVE